MLWHCTLQLSNGSAWIQAGEIKSSTTAIGKGASQLELRLLLLDWAIKAIRPNIVTTLTGYIYVPQSAKTTKLQVRSNTTANIIVVAL